jgi:hypothetical protein
VFQGHPTAVVARLDLMIQYSRGRATGSRSRGVLDHPLSRVMTVCVGAAAAPPPQSIQLLPAFRHAIEKRAGLAVEKLDIGRSASFRRISDFANLA